MAKKILIFIGTRPEIIKTAIIIKLMKADESFVPIVVSTGQHFSMLDDMLDFFDIKPDYDLKVMQQNQTLTYLSSKILNETDIIIKREKPDLVLVQGDTTTAFFSALSAYYNKVRIGHIEAGLRTYNKYRPFPEEINRQFIDRIADFLFAPTNKNYQNLKSENISKNKIFITGNTVVDSLNFILKRNEKSAITQRKMVLITAHRRENFGKGIENICLAIKELAEKFKEIDFIYPVHKNPNIQKPVIRILSGLENVKLTEPLPYPDFIKYLIRSAVVLTDSGGVQEEATSLGIPTIVLREITERDEGVEANILKPVGTDTKKIVKITSKFIIEEKKHRNRLSVYGDGNASKKIIKILKENL